MFDDTIVQILGNNPKNSKIKSILADVQEYNQEIEILNYKLNVYKRLYIDYIEPLIMENTYLKIENEIVQVVKVNRYSSYLEVYVCKTVNIKINGVDRSVIIQDGYMKDNIDYKTIITENQLNTGDLITYQSQKWLVISEVSQNNTIYKATIRKCRELKYKNTTIYGLVDSVTFDITDTKYFSLVDNEILITISDKNKIKLDETIEFQGQIYKVKAINNTIENTLILRCQFYQNTHSYELKLNTSNITIQEGQTYQIEATPIIDSQIDSAAIVEYISNDITICTVDKGLVIGLKAGTTTIKIKYQDIEEIVSINVLAKPQILYTLQGSETLDTKTIQTYTVIDSNNLPVTDKEFSWKLEQIGNTSPVTLTIPKGVTKNSYSLLGKSQYTKGSFILVATCKSDANIIIKKEIKVI